MFKLTVGIALGLLCSSYILMEAVYSLLLVTVHGHGSVVVPPPRQAIDKDLKPWNGPVPVNKPNVESKTGWCPVPSSDGTIVGQNGQACFWFSNGCAVGCPKVRIREGVVF